MSDGIYDLIIVICRACGREKSLTPDKTLNTKDLVAWIETRLHEHACPCGHNRCDLKIRIKCTCGAQSAGPSVPHQNDCVTQQFNRAWKEHEAKR